MKIISLNKIRQNGDTCVSYDCPQETQNVWMLNIPEGGWCFGVTMHENTVPYMNDSISLMISCGELGEERTFAATMLPLQTALYTTPYVPLPTSSSSRT